ncbi:unnamed protein product [Malus baccata var. baccata]
MRKNKGIGLIFRRIESGTPSGAQAVDPKPQAAGACAALADHGRVRSGHSPDDKNQKWGVVRPRDRGGGGGDGGDRKQSRDKGGGGGDGGDRKQCVDTSPRDAGRDREGRQR